MHIFTKLKCNTKTKEELKELWSICRLGGVGRRLGPNERGCRKEGFERIE